MKDAMIIAALLVAGIALLFGAVYGVRSFSDAVTPVRLHTPKPGITCATMVTGDGAAISCWKD